MDPRLQILKTHLKRVFLMAKYKTAQKMRKMSAYLLKKEGIKILPASTAGLIGLLEMHENQPLENDRFVAVLTAKN